MSVEREQLNQRLRDIVGAAYLVARERARDLELDEAQLDALAWGVAHETAFSHYVRLRERGLIPPAQGCITRAESVPSRTV